MRRRNWTERLARASARRPWIVVGSWVLVIACAVAVIATSVGNLTASDSFVNDPESKRAEDLIEERMPGAAANTEIVVLRSAASTVDDPAVETAVQELRRDIAAIGSRDIAWVMTYYDLAASGEAEMAEALVSADRRATIIPVTLTYDDRQPEEHVGALFEVVQAARADLEPHGLTVAMTGNATWEHEATGLADDDLKRGELIGMPIALVVLVVVFGALVAAGIPFVLALAAIAVALALISLIAGAFMLSVFAANVVTMMGLAVGIDYALFILSRFREERAAGYSVVDAVGRSAATASRAVVFSGITVVLALTGMLIIPFSIFISMGVGMILVVLCTVAAALTLLPALLALLGDRVNRLHIPFRHPQKPIVNDAGGGWAHAVRTLMRRPAVTLAIGAVILVALALPGLGLERGESGAGDLPASTTTRQGYEMLRRDFSPGLTSPLLLALDGDQTDPRVREAIGRLTAAAADDGRFQIIGYESGPRGDFGLLRLAKIGSAAETSADSVAVTHLREQIVPAAIGDAPLVVLVGGGPAAFADMLAIIDRMTPVVFAVVLSLSFILLLVAFRSLVIAALAVVMNLLSVGAAYGLLTLVFQHGIGAGVLGFQETPLVTSWVPLLLFCVLFGLSMDYQVFLLSRIREHYDRTGHTREAVVSGVSSTAGIITGAALIMVAVFGGMASGELVMFQQIGFGLGVAIFLDAAVVRTLVIPASMTLLGRWNWYLPKWLAWLPQVELEVQESTPASGPADIAQPAGAPPAAGWAQPSGQERT